MKLLGTIQGTVDILVHRHSPKLLLPTPLLHSQEKQQPLAQVEIPHPSLSDIPLCN